MNNLSVKKKVLTVAVATTMVLAMGSTAFAMNKDYKGTKAASSNLFKGGKGNIFSSDKLKTKLDGLVKSNAITQEQEDKILEYVNQKNAEKQAEMEKVKSMTKEEREAYFKDKAKTKTDLFSELISQGVITQVQADEISKSAFMKDKNADKRHEQKPENNYGITSKIDVLVKQGVITQEECDKIAEYFKTKGIDKKTDVLSGLVTDGVITQEKADAISKIVTTKGMPFKGEHKKGINK